MMAQRKTAKRALPNHTAQYIAKAPKPLQAKLRELRAAIRAAAPGATERTDYFSWPGYSYDGGYDYNGMFAWFSYQGTDARLHVRPPVIADHKKQLAKFATTKAVVLFRADAALPIALVKKLVKGSVKVMKDRAT